MFCKSFLYLDRALVILQPSMKFCYSVSAATSFKSFLLYSPNNFNCEWVRKLTNCSTNYLVKRNYARGRSSAVSIDERNLKVDNNVVVEKLQRILSCGVKKAQQFFVLNEKLFDKNVNSMEDLVEKCKYFEKFGITKKFIHNNPWVIQLSSVEIERKIELLKKWKFNNVSSNLCLLKLPTRKLSELTHKTLSESNSYSSLKDSNRITYLATVLKKEEEDISELTIKYSYLLTMRFSKLENTLDVLLKSGLDPKYICMDIWVVRYSVNDIKTRLKLLESFEPHELRAWMFHCGNETFQRTIKLKNENRNAREPFADDEAYLCHRLNISPETVEDLYQRHPPLRCVQTTKLRAILDYLFAEGFQSIDICRSPRILCHSLLTIKERMDHMKSLGYRPQSLAVCCQTKKKYKLFINKLQAKQFSNF